MINSDSELTILRIQPVNMGTQSVTQMQALHIDHHTARKQEVVFPKTGINTHVYISKSTSAKCDGDDSLAVGETRRAHNTGQIKVRKKLFSISLRPILSTRTSGLTVTQER